MFAKTLENLILTRKVSKITFSRYLGIARSTLDGYLSGSTFMPSDKIEKTAAYFKVSIGFLFGEVDEEGEYIDKSLRRQIADLTKQVKEQNKILTEITNKIAQ
jgi:transcriptional regulator with XRE-family HTH domain